MKYTNSLIKEENGLELCENMDWDSLADIVLQLKGISDSICTPGTLIKDMKDSGALIDQEDGVMEFVRMPSYYGLFSNKITEEIIKKPSVQKELIGYSFANRKEFLKDFKEHREAFELAFAILPQRNIETIITFMTIYLCSVSKEQDKQDYLFGLCKRIFRNIYKECTNNVSEYLDFPNFFNLAIKKIHQSKENNYYTDEIFIYHYFLDREYKTGSCYVLYPIYDACKFTDDRMNIYAGELPKDCRTGVQKKIKEFYDQTKECKIPDPVNYIMKPFEIELKLSPTDIQRTAVALYEGGQTSVKPTAGYLLGYIVLMNAWRDSCLDNLISFWEGHLLPPVEKEEKACKTTQIPLQPSVQSSKLDKLTKKLNHSEQQLSHEKAEHARTQERLTKEINELKEIIAMHEEANDINELLEESEPDVDFEQMVRWLNQYKCMVIGGHDHWIKQMQEYFPGWVYCTSLAKPIQDTQEYDAMVFYPKHIGHSLYYKFIAECRNKDVPRCLLNHANIKKVAEQIYYMFNNPRLKSEAW